MALLQPEKAANERLYSARFARFKDASKELYRGLKLLLNYRVLNHAAFEKLLIKHDHLAPVWKRSHECLLPHIDAADFNSGTHLQTLVVDFEVWRAKRWQWRWRLRWRVCCG